MAMPAPVLRVEAGIPVERQPGVVENARQWLSVAWTDNDPQTRHSRFVALLRRLLPALGIALLLLIAVWPRLSPLWDRMRFAFPAIDLRDARELDMINPRHTGLDRDGRPFVVTAVSARQLPDRQDLVSLRAPRADMKSHSGANIVVTAQTGVYQSQTQLLDLFDDVTLVHQNGTRFLTQSARVDAANNSAEGSKPIEGHGPSGDVKAEGFRIFDRGDKILFTGKSEMLLRGTPPSPSRAPDAAMAGVASNAVRTIAETKPTLVAARPEPVRAVPAVSRRLVAPPLLTPLAPRHDSHRPAHPTPATKKQP